MCKIILFDGECGFCDGSVRFVIKRDSKEHFKFAPLQSDIAITLLSQYNAPQNPNSIVLIEGNRCFIKSTAALRICKYLSWPWKPFYLLIVVPKPIRDKIYEFIAHNRYRWFGKKESCQLPSPAIRKRFLS